MTGPFTHFDEHGDPRMVDVGAKEISSRRAVAEGWIRMSAETLRAVREGTVKKGDVLSVARIAGITGAKRTADLIPLCHPLPLSSVEIGMETDDTLPGVRVRAEAAVHARTGVEMEALTAVASALLTVYDMCKALDRAMEIGGVRLVSKEGGRSGRWTRDAEEGA